MREHLYILIDGRIWRERNTLVFSGKAQKFVIPVKKVNSIHVFGNIMISSQTLKLLSKEKIILHFFTQRGKYLGSFLPPKKEGGKHRIKQYRAFMEKRYEIARNIVHGVRNSMLHFIRSRYSSEHYEKIKNIEIDGDIFQIRSAESQLWIIFYEFLRKNLKNLQFGARKFRPPQDEGNAIISFVNSLLYSVIYSELYNTELDTSLGFLHEPSSERCSLVLDIADIFKPLVTSSLFLRSDSILEAKDFEKTGKGVYLSHEGRKKVIELFRKKLEKVVYCKKLKKDVSIRTAIRSECIRLRDCIFFEKEYKPYVPW